MNLHKLFYIFNRDRCGIKLGHTRKCIKQDRESRICSRMLQYNMPSMQRGEKHKCGGYKPICLSFLLSRFMVMATNL